MRSYYLSVLFIVLVIILSVDRSLSSDLPSSGWHHPFVNTFHRISGNIMNTLHDITDEVKYRKLSLNQYREQISSRVQVSIDQFRKERLEVTSSALKDVNHRINQLQELYKDSIKALDKQKTEMLKLNEAYEVYCENRRRSRLDDSFDTFRKVYNETFDNILRSPLATGIGLDKIIKSVDDRIYHYHPAPFELRGIIEDTSDRFVNMMRRKEVYDAKLQQSLISSWEKILRNALEGSHTAEMNTRPILSEFSRLQDEVTNTIKTITLSTQNSIKDQIMKSGVRNESKLLELRLKRLEHELSSSAVGQAVDAQRKQMEVLVRNLQDKIHLTNSTYDGLISKRRNSMYQSYLNDATLNKALKLIDPHDKGWVKIRSEDGIDVYRKFMGIGPGSQYACVRCSATINASLNEIYDLFDDDSRVREYNSFYQAGKDLEYITVDTRVVWSASPPIFPFKARDFCTVVHMRKLRDGTAVILNRAMNHPLAPHSPEYVRAAIVLGANIIQPIPHQPNKCRLTMITQVDPGGFAPPMIINRISALGPVGFMKNVESAAKKKK